MLKTHVHLWLDLSVPKRTNVYNNERQFITSLTLLKVLFLLLYVNTYDLIAIAHQKC